MKPLALFALVLTLLLAGCGKGKTTDTVSNKFMTLAEKQELLERYVKFRRSYDDLHFDLSYIDGGSGMVPGPTEWNVRVLAVVPAGEIDQWIDGLSVASNPELDWISDIPTAFQFLVQVVQQLCAMTTYNGLDDEARKGGCHGLGASV